MILWLGCVARMKDKKSENEVKRKKILQRASYMLPCAINRMKKQAYNVHVMYMIIYMHSPIAQYYYYCTNILIKFLLYNNYTTIIQ